MLAAQVGKAVAQGLLEGTQWPSEDSSCPFFACDAHRTCPSICLHRIPHKHHTVHKAGPRSQRPQVSSGYDPEPASPRAQL